MKIKPITSIDTALYVYYTYPEIGNKEIRELFGSLSSATVSKYKRAVQEEQIKQNVKTCQMNTINTELAYVVWGIDVADLERRKEKLNKLGLVV